VAEDSLRAFASDFAFGKMLTGFVLSRSQAWRNSALDSISLGIVQDRILSGNILVIIIFVKDGDFMEGLG
jgi:hypothetical protein